MNTIIKALTKHIHFVEYYKYKTQSFIIKKINKEKA